MSETVAIGTYNPNGPAAIIFFLLFGVADIHLWIRYFRTRPRAKYMRILCVGAFFMSLGYVIRFTRRNHLNAWSFIFETLCLLLSPCAFLAQIYVLLPRLATSLNATDCLLLPRGVIVKLFLTADIATVLGQIAGVALQATYGDLVRIGVIVTTISLWVQLACFTMFLIIYFIFAKRLKRRPEHSGTWHDRSSQQGGKSVLSRWQTLYVALGIAGLCMTMRTIFRCFEYTIGLISFNNAFSDSEIAFYVLDGIPMLLFTVALATIWAPLCLDD